jgi:MoxR-like ATPase
LGRVLWWPITPRTELEQGLYRYDALDRLRDSNNQMGNKAGNKADSNSEASVDDYITLGPLGTAFIPLDRPRVLLIDEIDKSDLQLPNELLHLFEEGSFPIPQLQRAARGQEKRHGTSRAEVVAQVDTDDPLQSVRIKGGMVQCRAFPIVVMTSNNERDFPPAFYRRCIRVEMLAPSREAALHDLIENQFADDQQFATRWPDASWKDSPLLKQLIQDFLAGRGSASLEQRAIDQFLNAAHLLMGVAGTEKDAEGLRQILFRSLTPDR